MSTIFSVVYNRGQRSYEVIRGQKYASFVNEMIVQLSCQGPMFLANSVYYSYCTGINGVMCGNMTISSYAHFYCGRNSHEFYCCNIFQFLNLPGRTEEILVSTCHFLILTGHTAPSEEFYDICIHIVEESN